MQRKTAQGDHGYRYDELQRLIEGKSPSETEDWVYDPLPTIRVSGIYE
ncbi:MAG: hypothetical protein ABW185_26710 [Sedimenticola sp.]